MRRCDASRNDIIHRANAMKPARKDRIVILFLAIGAVLSVIVASWVLSNGIAIDLTFWNLLSD